jgi:prevent-host-death family protein
MCYIAGMANDVSVRELRNHTSDVIRAVEAGDTVYLTSRGRRIAEIRPLRSRSDAQRLIDTIDALPRHDSGAAADLRAAKAASIAVQARRDR